MLCALRPALAPPLLALSAALAFAQAQAQGSAQTPVQAGTSALDPAFRLPAGGRALAGPLVDSVASPNAVWLLSEDLALYALTDLGKLAARIDLSAGSDKPAAFLALDPFGRVIVARGSRLVAYTRMGSEAWSAALESTAGLTPPAFGSDGRAFIASGRSLVCVSPSGQRLWRIELPSPAACPPAVDGYGRPCVGLADGRILIATPYGELVATAKLGSVTQALCSLIRGTEPPGGTSTGLPILAAGLSDGSLLFLGSKGEEEASARLSSPALSLAWDGEVLYGLGVDGEAFAYSASGSKLWSTPTGCQKGRLYLFAERIVAAARGEGGLPFPQRRGLPRDDRARRRWHGRRLSRGPRLLSGLRLGPRRLSLRAPLGRAHSHRAARLRRERGLCGAGASLQSPGLGCRQSAYAHRGY